MKTLKVTRDSAKVQLLSTGNDRARHHINIKGPFHEWYPFSTQVDLRVDMKTNHIIPFFEKGGRDLHIKSKEHMLISMEPVEYRKKRDLAIKEVEEFNRNIMRVASKSLNISTPEDEYTLEDVEYGYEQVNQVIFNICKDMSMEYEPYVSVKTGMTEEQMMEVLEYSGNILTMLSVMKKVVS